MVAEARECDAPLIVRKEFILNSIPEGQTSILSGASVMRKLPGDSKGGQCAANPSRETAGASPDATASATPGSGQPKNRLSSHPVVLWAKIHLDLKSERDRAVFQKLKWTGRDEDRYFNQCVYHLWARAAGYTIRGADDDDRGAIWRACRATHKGTLSASAYDAIEREALGSWKSFVEKQKKGKGRIHDGLARLPQRLPEKDGSHLAFRGSGVRIIKRGELWVCEFRLRNQKSGEGSIQLPIARRTARSAYHSGILEGMTAGEIPILKAVVKLQLKKRRVRIGLTWRKTVELPPVGERVATLGPVEKNGLLRLHTETQTRDYTHWYQTFLRRKGNAEQARRRVIRKLGRSKGHARRKRRWLEKQRLENWQQPHLHKGSKDMIEWLVTQGVGTLQYQGLETGDWPAAAFVTMLAYKGAEKSIAVKPVDKIERTSAQQLIAVAKREQRKASKKLAAFTEIGSQIQDAVRLR